MNLRTLIDAHAHGKSNDQLANASGIGRDTIYGLRADPDNSRAIKVFPRPDIIRLLAHTLKITEQEIINAAAETLGLIQPQPEAPNLLSDPLTTFEPSKLATTIANLQEQNYYWQNHAATYKQYRQHFTRLQPIAQQRPWLIAGTQHQANHIKTIAGEQQ